MPPGAHPAHALLSAASALLRPADVAARPLPIEEPMPTDDVSDLRDVVDAINKLCDTMKTSYEYDANPETETNTEAEAYPSETETDSAAEESSVDIPMSEVDRTDADAWSEPALSADVAAEMYYSAIAEASLDMWNDSISEADRTADRTASRTCDIFHNALSDDTKESVECAPVECAEIETVPPKFVAETEPPNIAEIKTTAPNRAEIETEAPNLAEIEASPLMDAGATGPSTDAEEAGLSTDAVEAGLPMEAEAERYPKGSSDHTETQSTSEMRTNKCEAAYETSEMYYTASSEVSLLSETDFKVDEDKEKSDKNIMAGHVAAMRERFESMTRANTPCPDLGRLSPSLDMYRNVTPSPDFLDKS